MTNPSGSILALAVAALCSVQPCQAQPYQIRDSAGIAVVVTGPDSAAPGWSIGEEPSLTIGQIEGEKPYLFTRIWNALKTPDGRIVVVEGTSYQIRVFSSQGRHQVTFGNRGDGPEEFGGPPWTALAGSDTLLVWDPGHYRLSRYSLAGALLSQTTIRSRIDALGIVGFPNGLVWQIANDGALLWTGPGRSWSMGGGLSNHTTRIVLIPNDKAGIHDFGEYPSGQFSYVERTGGGFSGFSSPFARSPTAALGPPPDRVAISDSRRWEIQIFDALGAMRKIWRGRFPRVPVTRSMIAAARREDTGVASRLGLTRREAEKAFDALPTPDSVPAIGVMMWDALENLWVGGREGEVRDIGDYQVLDKEGRWLSTVVVPKSLVQIFEIGADYLLAAGQDEYGVQYLQEYEIRKPKN